MSNEVADGLNFLYTTLASDTALQAAAPGGVWRNIAPEATATPFVIIGWQGGIDHMTATANRLYSEIIYRVEAVGESQQFTALVTAANRIDALLGLIRLAAQSNYTVLACYRQQAMQREQVVDGVTWSHLGGFYRLSLQGA